MAADLEQALAAASGVSLLKKTTQNSAQHWFSQVRNIKNFIAPSRSLHRVNITKKQKQKQNQKFWSTTSWNSWTPWVLGTCFILLVKNFLYSLVVVKGFLGFGVNFFGISWATRWEGAWGELLVLLCWLSISEFLFLSQHRICLACFAPKEDEIELVLWINCHANCV